MNLEDQLREALRRENPSADFTATILAKTSGIQAVKARKTWFQRPFSLALAAAVTAIAIVPAVVLEYQRREEVRALKARQDLIIALAITKEQLQQTKDMIRRTTRNGQ
jgi:undecaprenyl pyrophosphate phosphatase UppP